MLFQCFVRLERQIYKDKLFQRMVEWRVSHELYVRHAASRNVSVSNLVKSISLNLGTVTSFIFPNVVAIVRACGLRQISYFPTLVHHQHGYVDF